MIKAIFIDGPEHGTTRMFECEPPTKWFCLGEYSMQGALRKIVEETDLLDLHPLRTIHVYYQTYVTRKRVYIYEYDGECK